MIVWGIAAVLVALYTIACLWFALRNPAPSSFGLVDLGAGEAPPLPAGFLWGTATAAHQVEGGNIHNDWWAFEQTPSRIARGERSGSAVDHWNRVREDIALMKLLGANAYRFSVEWSRVESRDGTWDKSAWVHYRDEVRRLRDAGIEPMVTLHHFTLPRWLAGGVIARTFPERFGIFAAEAARQLGREVTLWCTINEPNVLLYKGFVEGVWPPAIKDRAKASAAFANLLRAHAGAAVAVHGEVPSAAVGAAIHLRVFDPARRWFLPDWVGANISAEAFNWAFYDSIASGRIRFQPPGFPKLDEELPGLQSSADWLGVNYYTRDFVRFSPRAPGLIELVAGPGPKSDLGWEIYPEGLLRLLREAHRRYALPIYVTENGIADCRGSTRPAFLRAHVNAIDRAGREGLPVRGYFYWSLVDNFEWTDGFEPRFGLYSVNYNTMQRTPAGGSKTFAALAGDVALTGRPIGYTDEYADSQSQM